MIKQFIKNIFEAIGAKVQPVETIVPADVKVKRVAKVKAVSKSISTPKKKSAKK